MRVYQLNLTKSEKNSVLRKLRRNKIAHEVVNHGQFFDVFVDDEINNDLTRHSAKQMQAKSRRGQPDIVHIRNRWQSSAGGFVPITYLMLMASILMFSLSDMGRDHALLNVLPNIIHDAKLSYVAEASNLLFTSFFHTNVFQLLLNSIFCFQIIGSLENRIRSLRFALLITFLAVSTNAAAKYTNDKPIEWFSKFLAPNTASFGMSGLLYAAFVFMWIQSKYNVRSGIYVDNLTAFSVVLLTVLTLTPQFEQFFGAVANDTIVCGSLIGLIVGVVWAYCHRVYARIIS